MFAVSNFTRSTVDSIWNKGLAKVGSVWNGSYSCHGFVTKNKLSHSKIDSIPIQGGEAKLGVFGYWREISQPYFNWKLYGGKTWLRRGRLHENSSETDCAWNQNVFGGMNQTNRCQSSLSQQCMGYTKTHRFQLMLPEIENQTIYR